MVKTCILKLFLAIVLLFSQAAFTFWYKVAYEWTKSPVNPEHSGLYLSQLHKLKYLYIVTI